MHSDELDVDLVLHEYSETHEGPCHSPLAKDTMRLKMGYIRKRVRVPRRVVEKSGQVPRWAVAAFLNTNKCGGNPEHGVCCIRRVTFKSASVICSNPK